MRVVLRTNVQRPISNTNAFLPSSKAGCRVRVALDVIGFVLLTFGASETFANYPVGLHVTLSTPSTAQANGSPEVNLTKTINGPDSLTGSLDGHWVRSSVTSTGHVLWEASDGTTIGPFNFGGRGHWQYHYFADGYKGYFAASPTLTPTPTPTPAYSGPLWYVRTSGNDSNDGSSPSKAFRTVSKAASKAVAGHTVIIGGGTYAEDVT
ncbi:MAG TPA: DUF1565 domain-containing protein, partial [Pirellulaceae bacterium]|nr:DUF1565 domain-containing protein [Pirellulaceae bacterium]